MTPSQRRWFGAAALALVVPTGWAWYRLSQQRSDNLDEFHGARLGMTASDVRRAYAWPGTWEVRSEGDGVGELILDWTADPPAPNDEAAPVSSARFEFHQGVLVAIRAEVHDLAESVAASTEPIVLSPATVYYRAAEPDSGTSGLDSTTPPVRITILSRDCPTHAEEVEEVIRLVGH